MLHALGLLLELLQAKIERAELPRHRHLLALIQRLAAEHQHRIAIHRRVDLPDLPGCQLPAQIDTADLAGKQRMEWPDIHDTCSAGDKEIIHV